MNFLIKQILGAPRIVISENSPMYYCAEAVAEIVSVICSDVVKYHQYFSQVPCG
jgi:hypothetical protein